MSTPIAELFVSLGVKVTGLAKLDQVDQLLRTSATNAGVLVQALGQLQTVLTQVQQAAVAAQKGLDQAAGASQKAAAATAKTSQAAQKAPPVIRATGTSAKQAAIGLGQMTLAAGLLIGKLALLARSAFNTAVALKNFQQETGLSTDALQRWQYQARLNNVEGERMAALFSSLQTQAADIAMGRGDVTPWRLLGLAPGQDPLEIVDQLGERLRMLPKGIARSVASDLGIDAAAFRVLIADAERLNRSYKLNAEETKAVVALNRSWLDLMFKLERFGNRVFAQMAKPLNALLTVLNAAVDAVSAVYDWLSRIPVVGNAVRSVLYVLTIAFVAFAAAVAAGTIALGAQKLGLAAWAAAGMAAIPVTKGLAIATALLTKALAALGIAGAPLWLVITLIAAAIAAAILTIQDFITFLKGGESATGKLVAGLKKLLNFHIEFYVGLADGVKQAWKAVTEFVAAGLAKITSWMPDWLLRWLTGGSSGMKIETPRSYLPEMEAFAATPPLSGSRGSSMEQTNNVRIVVDGAKDPRAVGREVGKNLRDVLAEASYQTPLPSY